MPAHRKSAEILKMSGAFVKNPQRAREDAPGAAPLDETPPETLTGPEIAAWRLILEELPRVAITRSERSAIIQMSRIKAAMEPLHPTSPQWGKLDDAFRQWCSQMGMTLQSRIKLGSSAKDAKPNKFSALKDPS